MARWQLHDPILQAKRLKQSLAFRDYDDRYVGQLAERWGSKLPAESSGLAVVPQMEHVWALGNDDWPLFNRAFASLVSCTHEEHAPKDCATLVPKRHYSFAPDYLTLKEKTAAAYARLRQGTPGGFLMLPIQFVSCGSDTNLWFDPKAIPLCPFAVGAMLMANWDKLNEGHEECGEQIFYCPGGQSERRVVVPRWIQDGDMFMWQTDERTQSMCPRGHGKPGCCSYNPRFPNEEWTVWGILPSDFE